MTDILTKTQEVLSAKPEGLFVQLGIAYFELLNSSDPMDRENAEGLLKSTFTLIPDQMRESPDLIAQFQEGINQSAKPSSR